MSYDFRSDRASNESGRIIRGRRLWFWLAVPFAFAVVAGATLLPADMAAAFGSAVGSITADLELAIGGWVGIILSLYAMSRW